MKGFISLLWVMIIILVMVIFLVSYQFFGWTFLGKHLTFWPKSGWKKIEGCVAYSGTDYKYQFYGKKDWRLVTPDMGCGKSYQDAQTWGYKDRLVAGQSTDVSQTTVLLSTLKPSSYDKNIFEYFPVPKAKDLYLELGRITVQTGSETISITDHEWQYLKTSFRFK